MAELKVYKLHFNSCLHISNSRSDYSTSQKTIASDTMYAAITSCLAKLGEQIPNNGDLGFTISSLFPYYQKSKEDKDKTIYFFPKPMAAKLPTLDIKNNKRIKKIRYVDADYFSQILEGKDLEKNNPNLTNDIQSEYLCKDKIDKDFISTQVVQRIRLKDRTMHSDAEPYYVDRVSFKDYSGLYFIVQGDTTLLDKTLPLLAEEGIGTDRNVGNGYFEYKTDKVTISLPKEADYCVNLSVYFPKSSQQLENMMQDHKIAYDIQRRGGWITTYPFQSIRKNVIYGFSEGSVFKRKTGDIETIGRIIDLRPQWNDEQLHHIWRCGRSLVLPINV